MQIGTSGPEGTAAFHGDANGRAQQPCTLPRAPRAEAAGTASSRRLPSVLPLPGLPCTPHFPRPERRAAAVRVEAALPALLPGQVSAGTRPRTPGAGGWGLQGQPHAPGGCWDLEEGPAGEGRGGRGRRWLRGRGGGGTCSASASPAPPPAARGLQTRQSSCAPSIQARKSGSLIEPAFPLTQPQPRLIRSTEGKEAN